MSTTEDTRRCTHPYDPDASRRCEIPAVAVIRVLTTPGRELGACAEHFEEATRAAADVALAYAEHFEDAGAAALMVLAYGADA